MDIRIQSDDFDPGVELALLSAGRLDIGAVVSFIGLCRDEGEMLSALELEHYPGMAEVEIARIAGEALEIWPILTLKVIHRYGMIQPGSRIVFVGVASSHRQAAFEAAEFIMDYLKTSAPFWKREHLKNGDVGGWVEAKEEDDYARSRWSKSR